MQKHVNLVDLVKSFPTNICLQNLASIQKRTSPIKFANLAEKSAKGSISNLSTKLRTRLVSPVQLLHFLDPLIEIIQAVPHEETPCVGLYGNRPHMEHTLNDALTLGVAAPHALHANRSRVQIPEKLVDAGTTEHSPDVLLNALSLRRRMNNELNCHLFNFTKIMTTFMLKF